MDTQLYDEWVAALRSGKYPQERGKLHNPDGTFCCLGVLCEVLVGKQIVTRNGWGYQFDTQDEQGHIWMTTTLQEPILHMVGLGYADMAKLINMNDDDDKSFPEIADWLAERKATESEATK